MPLASALASARRGHRTIVVPYVLVDRARRARLSATVTALRRGGASALELGFPFSDPIADGPVLAAAHDRALKNGTAWTDLLAACRIASAELPTAVMTYANPLWHRGLAQSLGALGRAGATGLIVPDLSLEESPPFARSAAAAGLSLVLLAAPGVSDERVAAIARRSRGFLYLVGQYGTTGTAQPSARVDLRPLVARARAAAPGRPVLVGFGVRDRPSAERALATGADGVVVGTAVEERLERNATPGAIEQWIRSLASAARPAAG